MAVPASSLQRVAPYQTRVRLAVTGVVVAWTMAAIFLVLGWTAG